MIKELTTYINGIQKQFPLSNFIKEPARGLHIMFEVKNNEVRLYKKELYLPKKGEEGKISDYLVRECMPRELHINYIDSHKAMVGKEGKKIHSASPYALKIRKKSFDEEWKSWYPGKKVPKEEKQSVEKKAKLAKEFRRNEQKIALADLINTKISITSDRIRELVDRYFTKSNEVCLNKEDSETLTFQKYLITHLPSFLINNSDDLLKLAKDDNIFILIKNKSEEEYYKANENYLKTSIFNENTYNKTLPDELFGLSGYLNTASDKKIYLKHLTANFDINYRIPQTQALLLYTFERYRQAKAFKTNPLPIFIDKTELNNNVIDVVREEGNDVKFNTIIRKLFDHSKEDLGNYYLLYFDYRGELKDLDFVSSFEFKLEGLIIKKVIPFVKSEEDFRVKNVFDFELKITKQIFSNQLVKISNDKIQYRYFDGIDNNPKYISAAQWNVVMKYRKSFYDWVYKSRRKAVTTTMFHDILNKMILDDIRADEYKDGYHSKKKDIETKLNIWFSLWNYFSNITQSNELDMANKITELQKKMRLIRDIKGNDHIETDEEFAFTVGQIIYFLLDKSKAGNKSHALLEPFIQKSNIVELKKAITATFNAYKHEIDFGKGRFEKLFSEIMAYELDKNLKELTPIMLAGYFSNSTIYETSTTK
ncbi:MAG: hypothetical protein CMP12_10180 [Zunongwangia sp.]|uniref:CRISPR-associated protein Csh1 n=1 Tax=Zunongwangia profunda TaxID=398743 RepID=A0A3D5J1T5_9FLAO|nr:hypothetical protein [Zunongwangia sp.]HCV81226.1 hypothetical protein [Zunongwangia profunda]|tara:strand:- start:4776 stop:6728 length:1953 start_codon:yes stop_codon:yes gene_type:complete